MKDRIISSCIVGNTNAGKSTLINALVGKKISIVNKKRNTTQESIIGILNIKNTQIIIYDNPGLSIIKKNRSENKNIKNYFWNSVLLSDVILYIFDVAKSHTIDNDIIKKLSKEKKKIILLLNKIDLIKKNILLKIIDDINKQGNFNSIVPISAKSKTNLDVIVKYLCDNSYNGNWKYQKNKQTDRDNEFISEEITRNSILLNINEEIPYKISVINTKWKLINNSQIVIHQKIKTDNINHKKILLGKGGKMIKKIREYSQKELNHYFNKKIHLYLTIDLTK